MNQDHAPAPVTHAAHRFLDHALAATALCSGLGLGLPVQATSADSTLATQVQSAPLKDRAFQSADVDIGVRASTGTVNLSGWARTATDDALARKIATSVPGVTKVTSDFKSWSGDADPRP